MSCDSRCRKSQIRSGGSAATGEEDYWIGDWEKKVVGVVSSSPTPSSSSAAREGEREHGPSPFVSAQTSPAQLPSGLAAVGGSSSSSNAAQRRGEVGGRGEPAATTSRQLHREDLTACLILFFPFGGASLRELCERQAPPPPGSAPLSDPHSLPPEAGRRRRSPELPTPRHAHSFPSRSLLPCLLPPFPCFACLLLRVYTYSLVAYPYHYHFLIDGSPQIYA